MCVWVNVCVGVGVGGGGVRQAGRSSSGEAGEGMGQGRETWLTLTCTYVCLCVPCLHAQGMMSVVLCFTQTTAAARDRSWWRAKSGRELLGCELLLLLGGSCAICAEVSAAVFNSLSAPSVGVCVWHLLARGCSNWSAVGGHVQHHITFAHNSHRCCCCQSLLLLLLQGCPGILVGGCAAAGGCHVVDGGGM